MAWYSCWCGDDCDLYVDVAVVVEQHSDAVDVLFAHSHVQTRPSSLVHHVHRRRRLLQQQLHHHRLIPAPERRAFVVQPRKNNRGPRLIDSPNVDSDRRLRVGAFRMRMSPDAVNYVLLAEDLWIFLATTCQTMVDVRSSPVLIYFRNSLPEHIRQSTSIAVFKRSLKTFLL